MFEQLIQDGAIQNSRPVPLNGQIDRCQLLIGGNNEVLREADSAVVKYACSNRRLSKTNLLRIWKAKNVSFAAKCLVTLWWGHPDFRVTSRVYSQANIDKLTAGDIERSFKTLREEKDFLTFKSGLENLYRKFGLGGNYHLDGVGVSFFTKLFHFYFAANPPESDPGYLPVIADDIMRAAVFAEMIDRGEDVDTVFYRRNASLQSYTAFTDKFNTYAGEFPGITPFIMEDIVFNGSKGIGSAYVAGYNGRLCLPHWIAGRYNAEEQIAIVFNNLIGETYLFEGPTAVLWNEFLEYDYSEGFRVDELCDRLGCSRFDLLSFINELIGKKILVDHGMGRKELDRIKKTVNRAKSRFLKSSKGIGNFQAAFESVDNDYRSRIVSQGIPFSASVELTYACNEACLHCYNPNSPREGGIGTRKSRPQGEMKAEEYYPVLDAMKRMGVAKLIFTGGDPFMKKNFMGILTYAHKLKFAISVYTNGQALYSNRRLYEELIGLYPQYIGLSLYSTVPGIHDGITRRKDSCNKTMEVARWCYEDAIGLQLKCPIMQANKDSYGDVFDYAMSVNGMPQFDVNITSSNDGDCFASKELRLTEEQLREVLKDPRIPLSIENNAGVIDRQPEMMFCGAGDSNFNLQPDGTVSPCCAFPLDCGNIREKGIEEIWKESAKLRRIRALRYKDSDICGKEEYCRFCNRCMGQSFIEHGIAENHSQDNCFLAKIRFELGKKGIAPIL